MRVCVIVPVLDGEAFIAQTLRSVLNQTRPPDEVIVVDNGSRDRSVEIARSFGGIVRVIGAPHGGASAARNAGVAEATGEALMFLDADDLLGPTVLEELAAVLARRPGAIACCPWMRFERVDGCWLAAPASCAPRRPGHDDLAAWLTGWYHPPCSGLWSREAYEASGGWDPEVRVNTDGDVMMRALIKGVPLVPTEGGTAYYRRLPGDAVSLSGRRLTRTGMESRLMVLDRIARLLGEAGRLSRYRAPLAEAYDGLARDSRGTFADLHEYARDAARAHGGPEPLRRARRRIGRLADRVRRDARPPAVAAVATPAPAPDRSGVAGEPPLVSVIVPTFTRAHLLGRALNGVLAQTYGRFEVLIVDDGSTDDTERVVAGLDDPRLRYLRQPENAGVAAARNRGLREAAGDL
ncbi:MAG TPA: glycosyltransferase, partial [Arenibaculum sp.]|nr:glycosyltransferase [Arenibaculum sp.]